MLRPAHGVAQELAQQLGAGPLLLGQMPNAEDGGTCRGAAMKYPITPDGRYFVVRGRLWRMSDPGLGEERRGQLVGELMEARRAVRHAKAADDAALLRETRAAVDRAKTALGERGPTWWNDGSADLNRSMVLKTTYAGWYKAQAESSAFETPEHTC
jgi:hypothetical protein